MNKILTASLSGFFALILIILFGVFIGYMNTQSKWNMMNNATNAAFERQKVAHDEMWKVIKTNMNLRDELREVTFKAIEAYAERGKTQTNADFLWLKENYPNLNQTGAADFYQKLANIISDQNGKFTSVRNDVIFATNEYNNFVTNSWTRLYLNAEQCKTRDAKVITSSLTQEAVESGRDDLEWLDKK